MVTIDLNSDLGESYGAWRMGDDEAMLSVVSSANIACGFHAGDSAGILSTVRAAAKKNVIIGAHVSYPDLVGFGRRALEVSPNDLFADAVYQIGALQGMARSCGVCVRYVKPHGALYNRIAVDREQGQAVIDAIKAIDSELKLMVLANTPIVERARMAGLEVIAEAFADRSYTSDGLLLARHEPDAVLHDEQVVAARMVRLATERVISAVDGTVLSLNAASICVHGDNPMAVGIARCVRNALETAGVHIAPVGRRD